MLEYCLLNHRIIILLGNLGTNLWIESKVYYISIEYYKADQSECKK